MSLSVYIAVYFGVNVEIFNVLQSTGLQKVGHEWAAELNWTEMLKSHGLYNKGLCLDHASYPLMVNYNNPVRQMCKMKYLTNT